MIGRAQGFDGFRQFLGTHMRLFGLDANAPHLQGALLQHNPAFASWWDAFNMLHGAWQT